MPVRNKYRMKLCRIGSTVQTESPFTLYQYKLNRKVLTMHRARISQAMCSLLPNHHIGEPRGVLLNFQYAEVHANVWGLKFFVNQYLGSVNYNKDKSSIFRVHKSEKRKTRGIWCRPPTYWTQYLGSPKR